MKSKILRFGLYLMLGVSAGCLASLSNIWKGDVFAITVSGFSGPYATVSFYVSFFAAFLLFPAGICFTALHVADARRHLAKVDWRAGIFVLFLAVYTDRRYYLFSLTMSDLLFPVWLCEVLAIGMIPALCVFFYLAYRILIHVFRSLFCQDGHELARHERVFGLAFSGLAIFAVVWAFTVMPILWDGGRYGVLSEVVYTFDSQYHIAHDTFFYINSGENDIRNLLFGLFSLPVSVICHVVSDIIELIFGVPVYAYLIAVSQCFAVSASILLFARLLARDPGRRTGVYLLFATCYPVMLNILVLEQYAFSLFWIAAFLYFYISGAGWGLDSYFGYTASFCCLSPSVFLAAPVFLDDRKKTLLAIRNGILGAGLVTVVSGQLGRIFELIYTLPRLLLFCGPYVSFLDKIKQFLVFVRSVFLAPAASAFLLHPGWTGMDAPYAVYWLNDDLVFDLFGVVMLVFVVLSAVLNWGDKFSRFCTWWVFMSFFIMCIFGWGTYENGLVIYTLYFGWAYLCLVFKLIDRLFHSRSRAVLGMCSILAAGMLAFNIFGFAGMFDFLRQYYPA